MPSLRTNSTLNSCSFLRRRTRTCSSSTKTSLTKSGMLFLPLAQHARMLTISRATEKSLLEISELQTTLANNLSVQAAHIDQLVEDSFSTVENVGSGNKELKRATERRSTAQLVFWSTCAFCTTLVLWDLFI